VLSSGLTGDSLSHDQCIHQDVWSRLSGGVTKSDSQLELCMDGSFDPLLSTHSQAHQLGLWNTPASISLTDVVNWKKRVLLIWAG
jgi:hypothetical protein